MQQVIEVLVGINPSASIVNAVVFGLKLYHQVKSRQKIWLLRPKVASVKCPLEVIDSDDAAYNEEEQ